MHDDLLRSLCRREGVPMPERISGETTVRQAVQDYQLRTFTSSDAPEPRAPPGVAVLCCHRLVGIEQAGTMVLPSLAPLARFRKVALCGAQAVVYIVPRIRAALPSGTFERTASLFGSEFCEAAGSSVGAARAQDGQCVGPGGPVKAAGAVRSAHCRPRPPKRAGSIASRRAAATSGSASSSSPGSASRHRQDGIVVATRIAGGEVGRVRKMWSARGGGAHGEEEPCTLEVGQQGELLEQPRLFEQTSVGVGGDKPWVPERGAQGNEPALRRRRIATPDVRTEFGDARGSRPSITVVHPGFAEVRGDARGREALAGAQLRVCGDEGVVLAQGVQRRCQGVDVPVRTLLLKDGTPLPVGIPPEVLWIAARAIGAQTGGVVQLVQKRSARDRVIGAPAVE